MECFKKQIKGAKAIHYQKWKLRRQKKRRLLQMVQS